MERRLAAILMADVVGYSRLMEADEAGTLARLTARRKQILEPLVASHKGRIVKVMGDGVLVEFSSAVNAVKCAIELQDQIEAAGSEDSSERQVRLRVGINLGDIIAEGGDLYGDGINIAARLEALAMPGGIVISGAAHDQVKGKLDARFDDLGKRELKNISEPVRVYRVTADMGVRNFQRPSISGSSKASIAVLPLTNMSDDASLRHFSDGLTEDIITELSRIPELRVTARNSAFAYRDHSIDMKTIARELGATYLIEGSIRKIGNIIRITVQLIEGSNGNHIWAERFDVEQARMYEPLDDIVRSVASTSQTLIAVNEGATRVVPTENAEELAKRALGELYKLTRESLEQAQALARKIREMDPTSSKGHRLLALANHHLLLMGFSRDRSALLGEGLAAAEEAVRLDRNDERALWALGIIQGTYMGQFDEGAATLRQALKINPNYSLAYGSLGNVFALAGRADESIPNNEIAIRMNPRDPSIFFRYSGLSIAYFAKGDFPEARNWAEKAVAIKPDWWLGLIFLAASKACLGDAEGAKKAGAALMHLLPDLTIQSLPIPIRQSKPIEEKFIEALILAGVPRGRGGATSSNQD